MATLSVVVGTLGRPSLAATLLSIASQRLPGDETIVVSSDPLVSVLATEHGCRFVRIAAPGGDWGDTERQAGMEHATGDYVCFLDDDDVHVPGARQIIEDAIAATPATPLMFRMRFGDSDYILFLDPEIRLGNVGTPMIVLPNDPAKLGKWGRRLERGGDYDFIRTMKWRPDEVVWVRQIIAQVAPEGIREQPKPPPKPISTTRPLRVLLLHPGAMWSVADVEAGLRYGLERHGVEIVRYRLDARIARAKSWLHASWRHARKTNPEIPKPNQADVLYQAGIGSLEMALRHQVDVVLTISGRLLHTDILILMKRAGLRVASLFTESPYDMEYESQMAAIVDGCWTNERIAVPDLRTVNPNSGYLPHGFHPERHFPGSHVLFPDAAKHDVVFVGSGFPERITWFNAIDWSGINLGLYGSWHGLGLTPAIEACVKDGPVTNQFASALYSKAAIGLNLYRSSKGFVLGAEHKATSRRITHAESLSPRAYELAACGAFHLSEFRAEVPEVFGNLVPTFSTPAEASTLIRQWLSDPEGRARVAAELPGCVAESSWVERAARVIGDVQSLLAQPARAVA